ncbi:ABC transporter substrate-binding protein [Desulfogranum marinum]|uniref:ABC transporter substrate-binding protein n=1 Tax=Desulfogranum marinum TaxID=453220 RepID=UPI0019644BBF|nr:ABC transporter substrate-binding protein [Desulfogranum marinum]MBM9513809.1 ABC transporter substrate-binding protein [Desulfogranum marinum]
MLAGQRLSLLLIAWSLVFISSFTSPSMAEVTVITDSDKRTLVFKKPFTRIISLYPAHTRNLMDLGATDAIIATGRSDDQLPNLAKVHFRDDPERLIALRPDLVLIRPMISRSYPQLIKRLQQVNIQVASLQPSGIDELLSYWTTLGKLTGKEQESMGLISLFSQRRHDLQQQLAAVPETQRKRVYFEAIHKRMKTFAPQSMAMFVLETAGGINMAADAPQVRSTNIAAYSKERILAKADQIDVFLAQQGRMNPVTIEEIRNEAGFAMIKAVRENQIFLIDEKLVSRPTMSLLDAAAIIMEILYPEATDRGAST